MIRCCLIVFALFAASVCRAQTVEKFYYVGEMKLSTPTGQPMGSQAFLIEKTHDPGRGLIIERAVVVGAEGKADDFVMEMKVSGNSFAVSDRKGTTTGTGELFGPAWHWTYFKAEYRISNGVRVEDENFMTDPSVGTARKKVFSPDGKPLMLMEGTFKAITPRTFQLLSGALLGKTNPQAASKPTH